LTYGSKQRGSYLARKKAGRNPHIREGKKKKKTEIREKIGGVGAMDSYGANSHKEESGAVKY